MHQSTLKEAFSINGVGVHKGENCAITVKPAEEGTGIVFYVGTNREKVEASYANVVNAMMCTQIANENKTSIKTIEHLVAALYGMKVSNAEICVMGEEIPILDGSSLPFVQKIIEVGVQKQLVARKILRIKKKVEVTDGNKYEVLEPFDGFVIRSECDFEAKGLKTDPVEFDMQIGDFASAIAPARTFGFISEVEYIKKNKLALGAGLKNTVVYNDKGIPLNDEGLRMENESAKHKLLDIIGDLSLSRYWIQGKMNCFCPSHKLNNIILRMLFSSTDNYEIV